MRVFKKMNINGLACPICKTKEQKEVVLIGLDGTEHKNVIEAIQVHLDCIDLRIKDMGNKMVIYQQFEK